MRRILFPTAVVLVTCGHAFAQDKDIIKVDPEAFAVEVKKDDKAAAAKYQGKTIEMTGKVVDVHSNISGDVFLSLPSKTAGILGVSCFLKDGNIFGKVVKGQEVTVRGRYPDFQIGVQIMECELTRVGPSPALTLTAEQMTKEWAKDKAGAIKKWKDKVIIVSGEVNKRSSNDVGAMNVYLKGAGELRVDCGFTAFEKNVAEKINVGDKVKLVGEFLEFESEEGGPALRFCRRVKD